MHKLAGRHPPCGRQRIDLINEDESRAHGGGRLEDAAHRLLALACPPAQSERKGKQQGVEGRETSVR